MQTESGSDPVAFALENNWERELRRLQLVDVRGHNLVEALDKRRIDLCFEPQAQGMATAQPSDSLRTATACSLV